MGFKNKVKDVLMPKRKWQKEKCGKCPCTKLCCAIFWPIFIFACAVVALAIFLLVFFMYPRMPKVDIAFDKMSLDLKPAILTLNVIEDLSITVGNPNYFSIGLENLYLEMYYWKNNTIKAGTLEGSVNMGNVMYVPTVIFPAQQNATGKALQVTIYGRGMTASDWGRLMQDCSSSGAKSLGLQFVGNTTALVNSIKVPFTIPLDIPVHVPCCQGAGC